jgi:hypothetical protein
MELWSVLNGLRDTMRIDAAAQAVLALAAARVGGLESGLKETGGPLDAEAQLGAAISRVDIADLASAVDSVLERSAKSQGKVGGEHGFVGSRIATILGDLASTMVGGTLYDPACGIGGAMIGAIERGAKPSRVVGHEINSRVRWMAEQRAVLHGVSLETKLADVLAEDPDTELRADVILLEPPFGMRLRAPNSVTDPRFVFGTPPQSSAETAWIQHAIAHLTESGRAYVVTPLGTLFRGGEEARIRAELIRQGCVESVVGLPGKLLPQTTIALALWVLRRPTSQSGVERILFINAEDVPAAGIAARAWLDDPSTLNDVPHARVQITDLLASDSVLTPSRWVDVQGPVPAEIASQYESGWDAMRAAADDLKRVLDSSAAFEGFPAARVTSIGALVEQGVVDVQVGRSVSRYDDAPEELRSRMVRAGDIQNEGLEVESPGATEANLDELTRVGDILAVTMNTVRACVDEVGGRLPTAGVCRLRVNDHDVISPGYLAIVLRGEWNSRFQRGVAQQRAQIKDLEVPLIPIRDQRTFEAAVSSLQLLETAGAKLSSNASAVVSVLLDAVRYGATLPTATGGTGARDRADHETGEGLR